ncbi:MAG: hypothetical protein ACFFCO_13325 [Promethearchaeota archaeon]
MLERILRIGQLTGSQLVLLVDLHQIITFLIEFTIIALVVYKLSSWSTTPPKTYALFSITAVGVFAANIPSFLILLTAQFDWSRVYILFPISIALEFCFLLVLFLVLEVLPPGKRRVAIAYLFIAILVSNILSFGVFWLLFVMLM